jgi:hypothetical protein
MRCLTVMHLRDGEWLTTSACLICWHLQGGSNCAIEVCKRKNLNFASTWNRAILANGGQSPDAMMQLVEYRCPGDFSKMKERVPHDELATHAAHYKRLAGFSTTNLNAIPPIIGAYCV